MEKGATEGGSRDGGNEGEQRRAIYRGSEKSGEERGAGRKRWMEKTQEGELKKIKKKAGGDYGKYSKKRGL